MDRITCWYFDAYHRVIRYIGYLPLTSSLVEEHLEVLIYDAVAIKHGIY